MVAILDRGHGIAGTVKFAPSVPVERLVGFVNDMKSKDPERWVDLHIRGAGDDNGTHYIAFHYILTDRQKKTQKKAALSLIQYFRDQLGTRPKQGMKSDNVPLGVMGWSISTVRFSV